MFPTVKTGCKTMNGCNQQDNILNILFHNCFYGNAKVLPKNPSGTKFWNKNQFGDLDCFFFFFFSFIKRIRFHNVICGMTYIYIYI